MTLFNLAEYHRPTDSAEALRLLRRKSPKTVPLAGGTTLVGQSPRDVEAVVDLSELGLAYIRPEGGRVHIGAMTTLQALVDSPELAASALPEAALMMAGLNLRNVATLGGTLASGDWRSPVLTALLALDAQVTLLSPEAGALALETFLERRAAWLGAGGLITDIDISASLKTAYAQVGRTPADYPIVCAAAGIIAAEGVIRTARVALGGVSDRPVRVHAVEQLLEGRLVTGVNSETLTDAVRAAINPPDDVLGSAEYRREAAAVLARRVVNECVNE